MPIDPDSLPTLRDELDLLADLVPLAEQRIIELGCGNARLARGLVQRYAGAQLVGLEVDEVQHAQNVAHPQQRLVFMAGSAEAVPFPSQSPLHFFCALRASRRKTSPCGQKSMSVQIFTRRRASFLPRSSITVS